MKSIGLALLLTAQMSFAQSYRIDYQPKVGSVAKHEISVRMRSKASGPGPAPNIDLDLVLRTEQRFKRVTANEVAGEIYVKAVSVRSPQGPMPIPEYDAWLKGLKQPFSYAPSDPLGFLEDVYLPKEVDEPPPIAFLPIDPLPSGKVSVGEYWDRTSELVRASKSFGPVPFEDLMGKSQAVAQFREVDANGVGLFEMQANLPFEGSEGLAKLKLDLRVNTDFGIHMKSSSVRSLVTRSIYGLTVTQAGPDGAAVDANIKIESVSRVRALP